MKENKLEEMRTLIEELHVASSAYYNKQPIMNNYEYDLKCKQLIALEKETGITYPDSPTLKVGAAIEKQSSLAPVKHEYPARSLDKTQDIKKYIGQLSKGVTGSGKNEIVLMWKLDGSTIQATYENGKLILLATRGDGETGYDITPNAPYIKGLPSTISYKGRLTVRGEGVITHEEYERINQETGGKYADERSLANSTINHVNGDILDREIWFTGFNLVAVQNKPDTFEDRLLYMKNLGFNIVPYQVVPIEELENTMNTWTEHVAAFKFAVDGLVTALNAAKWADPLPDLEHNPNIMKGYAFKWEDETKETTLREIVWSASRTGLINPVAVFDSVDLLRTNVSRASVHNVSILKSLYLRVGDRISVYKANMIIPQIAENLDSKRPLTDYEAMPSTCPCCGGEVILVKFVELGFINEFADFWHLDRYKEQIVNLDGYGLKKYENLENAAENARHTEFIPFISSLNIPDIGRGQAKIFQRQYKEDVMSFFWDIYNRKDFTFLDGIGDVLSSTLLNWGNYYLRFLPFMDDADLEYRDDINLEIYHLLKEVKLPDDTSSDNGEEVLAGMTFVITGKLNHYENRDALVEVIESLGGKAAGSVSAKTSYLINNDVTSTSGKNKKAQDLGIPVISEEDFLKMIE